MGTWDQSLILYRDKSRTIKWRNMSFDWMWRKTYNCLDQLK